MRRPCVPRGVSWVRSLGEGFQNKNLEQCCAAEEPWQAKYLAAWVCSWCIFETSGEGRVVPTLAGISRTLNIKLERGSQGNWWVSTDWQVLLCIPWLFSYILTWGFAFWLTAVGGILMLFPVRPHQGVQQSSAIYLQSWDSFVLTYWVSGLGESWGEESLVFRCSQKIPWQCFPQNTVFKGQMASVVSTLSCETQWLTHRFTKEYTW